MLNSRDIVRARQDRCGRGSVTAPPVSVRIIGAPRRKVTQVHSWTIPRKACQDSRPGLDQNDPGVRRIDPAKVVNQGRLCQFGNNAGKFYARRAGTDHREIEQPTALVRLAADLRGLNGRRHMLAIGQRVGQRSRWLLTTMGMD